MKNYGTWWITVPPKPMNWRTERMDTIIHDRKAWQDFNRGVPYERPMSPEWAVERARDDADVLFWRQILQIPIKRRQARFRFGLACVLLINVLVWAALIEGGKWLLS